MSRKPNAAIMGDIDVLEDGEVQNYPMALLIEFDSPEQIREAIKTGNIEFTVLEGYSNE